MSMKKTIGIALALTLGLSGLAAVAAQAAPAMQEAEQAEVTLTGQLSESAAGAYVLVEAESGSAIALRGSEADLAENLGSAVSITGSWAVDDSGEQYFAVSSVEAR